MVFNAVLRVAVLHPERKRDKPTNERFDMIARQDFDRIEGATAYDNSGEKIGRVGQLYIDDETGEATWVTVSTGLFGLSESFAPLQGAEFDGKDIRLKYDKADGQGRPADR